MDDRHSLDRRQFLKTAAVLTAGAALSSCSHAVRALHGQNPATAVWPAGNLENFQLLRRLTYGPTPAERRLFERVGAAAWLEEQLAPDRLNDTQIDWFMRSLDVVKMSADELEGWKKKEVLTQLRQACLFRQIYSHKQLHEMMVEFWTDHFNISVHKGDCWYLKVVDDREVIRPNALGNFRDLLMGSARSPAMLIYLDNQANVEAAPNENYARELLELHTLGVEGGYSQDDVRELARCLTGWTVKEHFWLGEFEFDQETHDPGRKNVLGQGVPPAGMAETEAILDRLALHPATARRLAVKLVRRFVTDSPEAQAPALVENAAQAFLASDGEIRSMLKAILLDGVVRDPSLMGPKYKRPVDFLTSSLRMLGAETSAGEPLQGYLEQMGQPPYGWPMPDGPGDLARFWSTNLLPRWQFALALCKNSIAGTRLQGDDLLDSIPGATGPARLDAISIHLFGQPLDHSASSALLSALDQIRSSQSEDSDPLMLASLLASPNFQWR